MYNSIIIMSISKCYSVKNIVIAFLFVALCGVVLLSLNPRAAVSVQEYANALSDSAYQIGNLVVSQKNETLVVDRLSQNCSVKVNFNPYEVKGFSLQRVEKDHAVYEGSCLPLQFSSSIRFPPTALASHPGSGNTWSRHLIQQLTGE